MVSFVSYVLQAKNDNGPLGDVARDMLEDDGINKRWGYRSLIRYLETYHNPCERVMNILSDANTAHNTYNTRLRLLTIEHLESQ